MKPKKPHPRRRWQRPELRPLAAPPPENFYRLPELELRGGSPFDRWLPPGAGLYPAAHLPGYGRHSGNIVWRGSADRILRGQKTDTGRALHAGGAARQMGGGAAVKLQLWAADVFRFAVTGRSHTAS